MSSFLTEKFYQFYCKVVAIDLSAAFDTVDHDILLDVLTKRFGVKSDALNWFDN